MFELQKENKAKRYCTIIAWIDQVDNCNNQLHKDNIGNHSNLPIFVLLFYDPLYKLELTDSFVRSELSAMYVSLKTLAGTEVQTTTDNKTETSGNLIAGLKLHT